MVLKTRSTRLAIVGASLKLIYQELANRVIIAKLNSMFNSFDIMTLYIHYVLV